MNKKKIKSIENGSDFEEFDYCCAHIYPSFDSCINRDRAILDEGVDFSPNHYTNTVYAESCYYFESWYHG